MTPNNEPFPNSFLCENENMAAIVAGRAYVEFADSADKVYAIEKTVQAWAKKLDLPLAYVHCNTTTNWPDEPPTYDAAVIGIVSFFGHGNDEGEAQALPRGALDPKAGEKIPDEFWSALDEEHGLRSGESGLFLAVAGWTWASIRDAAGNRLASTSAEDEGYRGLSANGPLLAAEGPLEIVISYC